MYDRNVYVAARLNIMKYVFACIHTHALTRVYNPNNACSLLHGCVEICYKMITLKNSDVLKCLANNWLFSLTLFVRRAGLIWSQQDFEWWWSVPLSSASLYLEFSFILFDLCLFITTFNFILNYVPIVTFWIFTYHKIWILLIIFCFIWNCWIIYFLTCLEVFWSVVS